MEENTLEQLANRLARVNEIVAKLDPAIRLEAFNLLRPFVLRAGKPPAPTASEEQAVKDPEASQDELSAADFFSRFNSSKPAENVCMAAAYVYHQQGKTPFTLDHLRELAASVGLPVPDRLDKTLLAATRDGKSLFRRVGKGAFEPTVHGELYLRGSYPRSAPSPND